MPIDTNVYIGLVGAAARGLRMIVTTRVSDDLAAEVDRLAMAQGQTRAAWLALAIARAALTPENRDVPVMAVQSRGDSDDQVRVTVRLDRREIEAIDTVRAPLGLTRNEWIKRTLRWQLWDKAGALRLATISQVELGKLRKQVLGIGRNINQAVHAMNAANQPESSLDVARIAGPFIETCTELKTLLFAMRRSLSSYVGGEVGYWTGASGRPGE